MVKHKGLALPLSIVLSACILGFSAFLAVRQIGFVGRSVAVKGLAERIVDADVVSWPIKITGVSNDVSALTADMRKKTEIVCKFLQNNGLDSGDFQKSSFNVIDRKANLYAGDQKFSYRYFCVSTVVVYTHKVENVRKAFTVLPDLVKQGILINTNNYDSQPSYFYTKLSELKPQMIQQATENAREVALKFAQDSQSKVGKIKSASQGLFTIVDRDNSTPYIKKVRVVSTVNYYLVD